MVPALDTDYLLVGGGLQNALIVLALAAHQPGMRVTVLERGSHLGGNHTWSFHLSDLDPTAGAFAMPLVQYQWPSYEVRFPNLHRVFEGGYCTTTSAFLDRTLKQLASTRPNIRFRFGCEVESVSPQSVTLENGERICARAVIDSRGPGRLTPRGPCGYQKFVGLELGLKSPSPRTIPLLKDNTVPQTDGYRFFYVLPLAPDRVLIEDTYYSDTPYVDQDHLVEAVLAYALGHGFEVAEVVRLETGALPIPRRYEAPPASDVMLGGYAGGWFHPTTGYSMPVAVRLAAHVGSCAPEELQGSAYARLVRQHRRQARYCTLLNCMLFDAYPPEKRWHVLERFHRLPQSTIERFYALQLTGGDQWRILAGRPPKGLSVRLALKRGLVS